MTIAEAMIAELNQEAVSTRRLFERLPEDKLSWRPHPKSFSLGQLSLHIARLPAGVAMMAAKDVSEPPSLAQEEPKSRTEILQAFEQAIGSATEILSSLDDQKMMGNWSMKAGEISIMSLPRINLLRAALLNHLYHHRGQLSVYLRLLDVPLPSIYGPTADENPFG